MVQKKPNPKSNMVKYLDVLTVKEKAVICYLANHLPSVHYELPKTEFHQGLLPFLPVEEVVYWLKQAAGIAVQRAVGLESYKRMALGILAKLQPELEREQGTVNFLMRLDNKKIYRRFGPHPEHGKPLNFLPKEKVTVGVKWSLPKKQYVDDKDVLVSPCVQLVQFSNVWEVKVSAKCRAAVESWLMDNCM